MRDFLFTFIVTNITFNMCREETCYCIGSDSKEEVFPFWLFCSHYTYFTNLVNEKYWNIWDYRKCASSSLALHAFFQTCKPCLFWPRSFSVRNEVACPRLGLLSASLCLAAGINDSDWTRLISLMGMTQFLHVALNMPFGNFRFQCWYNL